MHSKAFSLPSSVFLCCFSHIYDVSPSRFPATPLFFFSLTVYSPSFLIIPCNTTNVMLAARCPLHPVRHLPARHSLSSFTTECSFYEALHFLEERIPASSFMAPLFQFYCHVGNINLALPSDPPEPLLSLFSSAQSPSMSFGFFTDLFLS